MSEINLPDEGSQNLSDFTILQTKIREKFYELGLKRKLLADNQVSLRNLDSEKHSLQQKVETAERQLSDVNIHLQVAIKAAREAEAERSTARELMARQGAQLEAASKEREFLQQANREIQLQLEELKREFDNVKSKMLSQSQYLDLLKKKDSQNKATIETLTLEINKLENSLSELKQMCLKITQVTKIVISLLNLQKKELTALKNENVELHGKVISLNAQAEETKETMSRNEIDDTQLNMYSQWEQSKIEVQKRLNNANEENQQLQAALDQALLACSKLRESEDLLNKEIQDLKNESENSKEGHQSSVHHKETQTTIDEEILCLQKAMVCDPLQESVSENS